jgi:VanZ family protein
MNTPPAAGKPFMDIGVNGLLAAGLESVVTLTSGPEGTVIFVDGKPLQNFPGVRLLGEKETLDGHRLYLGNAPDLNCPWAGDVLGVALQGRALSAGEVAERHGLWVSGGGGCASEPAPVACWRLERPEGEILADLSGSGNMLAMPGQLVFEKHFLKLPDGHRLSVSDIVLNVLGFVPFGFLIGLRLRVTGRLSTSRRLSLTAAAGFAASLVIEAAQTWLPGRDSSLLDLVTNTAGMAIGGAMAGLISWKRTTVLIERIRLKRPAVFRRSIF